MKKRILSIIIGATLALQSFSVFAVAEKLIIDGQEVTIPSDMGSIKEKDDRTFVPVRFIAEYLGCGVHYSSYTENGTIKEKVQLGTPDGRIILLTSGSRQMIVFSSSLSTSNLTTMDTETFIDEAEGRTYLPIRFFAESLGYTVGWDEATQTVSLAKLVEETPAETPEETPADTPTEAE